LFDTCGKRKEKGQSVYIIRKGASLLSPFFILPPHDLRLLALPISFPFLSKARREGRGDSRVSLRGGGKDKEDERSAEALAALLPL